MNLNETLSKWDEDILLYVQDNLRNAKSDRIMRAITKLGNSGFIWIVLAFWFILGKKNAKVGFSMLLTLAIGLIITNATIKNSVRRIRPFYIIEELSSLIPHPKDWSFPSGHATSSIGCGIIMLRKLKGKIGAMGMTLGTLISISRIYLGVHYPSDVIAGAIVGLFSSVTADKIMSIVDNRNKLKKKYK